MDWIERLNKAISYLEEHIKEETDYEQAAKIAVRTVNSFLNENEQAFELVEWVLFDDYTKQVYDEAVEKLRQGI